MRCTTTPLLLIFFVFCLQACHLALAEQSLEILTPASLRAQFPNGIDHRAALFGFPSFGHQLTGDVVFDTNNTLGCVPFAPLDSVDPPVILLIWRGNCTFVTKVRNAENAGAKAVIVVDNIEEAYLPYMANDGTGDTIEIPSLLVRLSDGLKIKNDVLDGEYVQVVMKWALPNDNDVVQLDIWTSSNILDARFKEFRRNFAPVANTLGQSLYVVAHYYIIDGAFRCMRPGLPCGSQCIMEGRYCAADPEFDLSRGLDGADVVIENLRQVCLWKFLNSTNQTSRWWEYVNQFDHYCAINENTWTVGCSENILTGMKIDTAVISSCIASSGGILGNGHNVLLDAEIQNTRDNGIFIIPTVAINNVFYRGSNYCPSSDYDHCGIYQAICAGYQPDNLPKPCDVNPDSDTNGNDGNNGGSGGGGRGVSVGVVIAIVAAALILAAIVTFFVVRRQQRRMREDLDSILASYMPIDEGKSRGRGGDNERLVMPESAEDQQANM